MNKLSKSFITLMCFFLYFILLWIINWPMITLEGFQFNSSLFLDFSVIVLGFFWLKESRIYFQRFYQVIIERKLIFLSQIVTVTLLSFVLCLIIKIFEIPHPFRFIEYPFLFIVCLAPVIEELLFRIHFPHLLKRGNLKFFNHQHENRLIWASSLLFSFSHLAGLWVLPSEYSLFVFIQLGYTLVLGRMCHRLLIRYQSFLAPWMAHGAFNLVFYGFFIN